jgi:hypothetical protein
MNKNENAGPTGAPSNSGEIEDRDHRGRFKKGSGKRGGRRRGSRNATTRAMEALLDGEGEVLTRRAIELAKSGDMAALRLCLDRILPPRRDRPIAFPLPPVATAADATATISALLAAVAAGDVTPIEAAEITKIVESFIHAIETTELLLRIERLESQSHE